MILIKFCRVWPEHGRKSIRQSSPSQWARRPFPKGWQGKSFGRELKYLSLDDRDKGLAVRKDRHLGAPTGKRLRHADRAGGLRRGAYPYLWSGQPEGSGDP